MSIATSTPELFTNMIGTFITQSDIGIGTIVGSSMFNALGVAAIGGLAAPFVSISYFFYIFEKINSYLATKQLYNLQRI